MNTLRALVALVLVDVSSGLVAPALAPRAFDMISMWCARIRFSSTAIFR